MRSCWKCKAQAMGTQGSDGTAAPWCLPRWLFDTAQVRGNENLTAPGNEGQCAEPIRRGRTGELLAFWAAATLDYQQPAVGRSFRWLRIEPFNWRTMNIMLCQVGMAKCKDVFPEPRFLDVPLHMGSAPSQTPGFRLTISVSWKKKKTTYAFPSRYLAQLCSVHPWDWGERQGEGGEGR